MSDMAERSGFIIHFWPLRPMECTHWSHIVSMSEDHAMCQDERFLGSRRDDFEQVESLREMYRRALDG
jgi:hypothetical protein